MKNEQGAVDADDVGEGAHEKGRRAEAVQQCPDLPENLLTAQRRAHEPRVRHLAGHRKELAAFKRCELKGLRQSFQDIPVQPRLLAPFDLAHDPHRQSGLVGQSVLAPTVPAGEVDLLLAQRGHDLAESLVLHALPPPRRLRSRLNVDPE